MEIGFSYTLYRKLTMVVCLAYGYNSDAKRYVLPYIVNQGA